MNKEPEALRLAKWIEGDMSCHGDAEIATELRRLHEVNVDLLAALQTVLLESYDGPLHDDYRRQARAAIAKAEGQQK